MGTGASRERCGYAVALLLLAFCALAGNALAEPAPELLWEVPQDKVAGETAGRMLVPRGLAADPVTGNVFISDRGNHRIDEFTVWGEFVRAWGFGVVDGSPELQVCTASTGCREGLAGQAPGQLEAPAGVTLDAAGDVYVYDLANARVTKYSPSGEFLLMFGGEVNKTTAGNVCTQAQVESGDECGAGVVGSAPGFFENQTFHDFIASSPGGTIYVGDKGRIEEFETDGSFKGEIPFTGELSALAGQTAWGLAVDPISGDIYIATSGEDGIYRISPTGELREKVSDTELINGSAKIFPVAPETLATDSEGNLYAIDDSRAGVTAGPYEVLEFGPAGECLVCGAKWAQPEARSSGPTEVLGLAAGSACGIPGADVYVSFNTVGIVPHLSYLQSYGPAPQDTASCPPPHNPPGIDDQYASMVGTAEAEVGAQINPRFWNDTTYYVQYGGEECFQSEWQTGCETTPAQTLTSKVLNRDVATAAIRVEGLAPDTTYYYRFVAESSGGGPVRGVGGTEAQDGEAGSFHTFAQPLPARIDCPNQARREEQADGPFLPDCRAFEMVSPVDKNGGDIATQQSIRFYPAELDLVSGDGDSATFSSQATFANAVSAPYSSQYFARRGSEGWQTEAISPPRTELFHPAGKAENFEHDVQYKLFSSSLNEAFLMQEADPPLDGCGVPGYINWYRRDNLTGSYEAITTVAPAGAKPLTYLPEVQGASTDGMRTIFRAKGKLTPNAASITGYQLYEHVSDPLGGCGETRLVSVLPNGTASTQPSSAGTAAAGTAEALWIESRENQVHNAVSEDGSRIYWTAAADGPGQIYLRLGGSQTVKVSAGAAQFWSASRDGLVAYFTEGEKLFRYTLANQHSTQLAGKVVGLVAASEDGARVYFASEEALAGGATAGQPNLYLAEGSSLTYIGTLSQKDISPNTHLTPTKIIPVQHSASLSEDGAFLAFASDAPLTGADNRDTASGLRDTEAFLFEAESGELRCISCNPTGARPTGRVLAGGSGAEQGFAATIPPWKDQFHAPRVIAAGGSEVFFESLERLVPRDNDSAQDVYVWQRAADAAACQAIGAESFDATSGGCLSLLSGAASAGDAHFVDSTPDGSNALIRTGASLVPQDPGHIDLYDARVDGGFPVPRGCEDPEGCPPPGTVPAPPGKSSPGSNAGGEGNPSYRQCDVLKKKAHKLAAKARKLRGKAAKAKSAAKARKLRAKAKKLTKQARQASGRAQACYTGTGGGGK